MLLGSHEIITQVQRIEGAPGDVFLDHCIDL